MHTQPTARKVHSHAYALLRAALALRHHVAHHRHGESRLITCQCGPCDRRGGISQSSARRGLRRISSTSAAHQSWRARLPCRCVPRSHRRCVCAGIPRHHHHPYIVSCPSCKQPHTCAQTDGWTHACTRALMHTHVCTHAHFPHSHHPKQPPTSAFTPQTATALVHSLSIASSSMPPSFSPTFWSCHRRSE